VVPPNHAPVIDPVAAQTVAEGSLLSFTVIAGDPDAGDQLTFSLDGAPAGASIDPMTGMFTWTPPDGLLTVDVTVRVTDDAFSPLFDTETFSITVDNVAPTLTISGEDKAYTGVPYELSLSSSDPGDDTITGWTIDWNDGTVEDISGNPSSVFHTYTAPLPLPGDFDGDGDVDGIDALRFVRQYRLGNVGGLGDFDGDSDVDGDDLQVFSSQFGRIAWDAYQVTATATDEDGTFTSNTLPVVDPPPPTVSADVGASAPVHAGVSPALAATGVSSAIYNPGIGSALKIWQDRASALRDYGKDYIGNSKTEYRPFEYKPWSLIDLYGKDEDEDLLGGKRVKKAESDSTPSWVEKFVSDFSGLEDSMGPNSDIRIVLSEGDELDEL
jgi:hypothetical protein